MLRVVERSEFLDSVFVPLDVRSCRRALVREWSCDRSFLITRGRASTQQSVKVHDGCEWLTYSRLGSVAAQLFGYLVLLDAGPYRLGEEGQGGWFILPLGSRGCIDAWEKYSARRVMWCVASLHLQFNVGVGGKVGNREAGPGRKFDATLNKGYWLGNRYCCLRQLHLGPDMQGKRTVDRMSQRHVTYQNLFEDVTASWIWIGSINLEGTLAILPSLAAKLH